MFVVAVLLVFFASFLALAETSITRMSRHKATVLADEGRPGGKELLRITEHPETYLNPVLLVVLASHLAVATLIGLVAEKAFGAWGVLIGVAVRSRLPFRRRRGGAQDVGRAQQRARRLARRRARRGHRQLRAVALAGARPHRRVERAAPRQGAQAGARTCRKKSCSRMTDAAADDDVIEQEERQLIRSVFEFGDTVAREVMVPRPDIVACRRWPAGVRSHRRRAAPWVQPDPGLRREHRQRHRRRVHQGSAAGRARRPGRGRRAQPGARRAVRTRAASPSPN